ncbi:MAG: patatin-like protein [Actinomycetota bacterium]|nr:patatin-like protein [Actinomycetota bacterium]
MPDTEAKDRSGERELRLALVCYGGVSLAIYMHGITKEVQKLVSASAAFEADSSQNPFDTCDSSHGYWNVLSHLGTGDVDTASAQSGVTLRVVVDIISGTSAGGINGVCLAKALAGNHSQDSLRDLWLERGDIGQLLRGWRRLPVGMRALWLGLSNPLKIKPLLRGDDMCRWLHVALCDMDREHVLPGVTSLVPSDHELQLFVPITDFHGYERDIPIYDPRFVRDRTHRHVMKFRHRVPGGSDFGSEYNHVLAFSARATSSFPGAFPPISFDGYNQAFDTPVNLSTLASRFFPLQALADAPPQYTQFIDGGVLDNFPFQSAIDAITAKPAATEVDRRLVFIEPDPGPLRAGPPGGKPPGLWRTVFAAYAAIPRHEPILDDLLRLRTRNEIVQRLRDVIETNFTGISDDVTPILQRELGVVPERPTPGELVALRQRIEDRAAAAAGFGYDTYMRLRVRTVIDDFAAAIADVLNYPSGSYQRAFITAVLRRQVGAERLLDQEPNDTRRAAQRDFLTKLDRAYHERRIRFLIAAMNWWYRDAGTPGFPPRTDLNAGKKQLYDHIDALHDVVTNLAQDPTIMSSVREVFSRDQITDLTDDDEIALNDFFARHANTLGVLRGAVENSTGGALTRLEQQLHTDLLGFMSEGSSPEVRGALLCRYLGFPFWDILVYPLQALSGLGEQDHVEVYRMSPRDVTLLCPTTASQRTQWQQRKLQGMTMFHFGAFFDRPGRECDYLWGRLDAAERLVKLLLDAGTDPAFRADTPGRSPSVVAPGALAAECTPLFHAILDDERNALPHAADLIAQLEPLVSALSAS